MFIKLLFCFNIILFEFFFIYSVIRADLYTAINSRLIQKHYINLSM